MQFYYRYDQTTHEFAGTIPASGHPNACVPDYATRIKPTEKPGFWPVWNGAGWEYLEDHRGQIGFVDGKQAIISELGPLPESWSAEPPFSDNADSPKTEKRQAILAELAALDAAYIRPSRAIAAGNGTAEDNAQIIKLDKRAVELRSELASLSSAE